MQSAQSWRVLLFAIGCRHRQQQREVEGAALAQRAVQQQFSTHQGHQPLADGHAQAGAAKAPRGAGFGLREAAEDAGLVFRRDADAGVAHRDAQRHAAGAVRQHLHRHHHFAPFGELDGVAGQIDQHLLQAHGVAHQAARQRGVDVEQHLHRLDADVGRHDHRQVAHQLVDAEGVRVQQHLAGFDFGEVEDVVQQPQQRARRTFGLAGVVGLARRQLGLLQQRQHAEDGVHGRANLMAHVGQKLALGHAGLFGLRLGRQQGLALLALFGHVGVGDDDTQGVVLHRHGAHRQPDGAFRCHHVHQRIGDGHALAQRAHGRKLFGGHRRAVFAQHGPVVGVAFAAQVLFLADAQQPLGSRVAVDDAALRVGDGQAHRQDVVDGLQPRQRPAGVLRSLFGLVRRLHELGNVNAKAHRVAVGHAPLDDAQRAAVGQALRQA